jgi:LPS-assembly lipoprotein
MWWLEAEGKTTGKTAAPRLIRGFGIIVAAAFLGGCFQPLYGDKTATGESVISNQFAQVEVAQIPAPNGTAESRIAVELRNNLVFALTGGAGSAPPTHQLKITFASTRMSVWVDVQSSRAEVENFGLNASYQLIDLKTGKPVLRDATVARVSYDIPGQEQRFAKTRALRDAETRAAKVISDAIQARLASYFIAKT